MFNNVPCEVIRTTTARVETPNALQAIEDETLLDIIYGVKPESVLSGELLRLATDETQDWISQNLLKIVVHSVSSLGETEQWMRRSGAKAVGSARCRRHPQ